MHVKLLMAAAITAVVVLAPAAAEASCCDQKGHAAQHQERDCCQAACCEQKVEPSAIGMLMELDPQLHPAAPVRQSAEVWFHRPAMVGKAILQGRYVVEHDNDRMARGEPCTHFYAYDDQVNPVATFHCTHLERDRASQNVVVVATISDGSMQRLVEFQFAGENFAHGHPTVR
jgi:hypothetical protein